MTVGVRDCRGADDMRSLVIYASTKGNTRRLAEAMAGELRQRGEVELVAADEAPTTLPTCDLVLIGAPTEAHTMSKPMQQYFDRLDPESVRGTAVAAYDTRIAWPRILSGSAADAIAKRLRSLGARLVAAPESFMVSKTPELEPGEVDRAITWARGVADSVGERLVRVPA
jgi:flavodoxin